MNGFVLVIYIEQKQNWFSYCIDPNKCIFFPSNNKNADAKSLIKSQRKIEVEIYPLCQINFSVEFLTIFWTVISI